MATESPMRILQDSRKGKWVSAKDTVNFASPMNEVAADELGLLLKGHKIHGHNRNKVPNRSGSAPPSMEGSFSAYGNLVYDQSSGRKLSLASLDNAMQNWQSEEQMRADPSYFAYYNSNVNLNPRLPPPIISRENRHLAHHFADLGDSCQLNSSENSKDGSLHVTRSSLSTHDEEPEDENLPQSASGQHLASFAGQHKSLVDLIQEDFPRTPSPVYNQTRSSGHVAAEEPTDSDMQSLTLDGLSLDISNKHGADACGDVLGDHDIAASNQPLAITLEKESCVDSLGKSHSPQKGELPGNDAHLVNELLVGDEIASGILKNVQAPEASKNEDEQYFHSRNAVEQKQQQQYHSQRSTTYQVNGPQVQANTLGTNTLQSSLAKGYGQSWSSSVEVQAAPQGSGLTPPLYATAAAYMASGNPYYSNLSPSGGYAPQYNIGGYALSSPSLSPFLAGYPSMHINTSSGRSISGQNVAPRENIPQVGDLHHLTKFFGHHGLMVHPFPDPFHMQYFHHPHPVDDSHTSPSQHMRFPSPGVFGLEVDAYASQKEPNLPSYIAEQNFLRPPIGSLNLPSPGKMIIPGNNYFGSPSGLGFTQQFPASPLGSPVLPGSPIGRRNEIKPSPGSGRNNGLYSGWTAQRGPGSLNDSKRHSFLEELKQSNARRIDLSDIAGRVVEFSVDQHGSRFIQQKLENCSIEEKASVFKEILPHASKLITDVFGNYVIQKFFEHGSHEQRKMLACQLGGQMLPLSLQMYGCRVIQKALEVIDLDQKTELVHELNGHVMKCVRDQNGNHVIQKCIECIPPEKINFIISSFQGQVAILSTHPYGCRVIQRILEHCSENSQSQSIVHEILESAYPLAQDQYGNYVTQHVLERGRPHERSRIIGKLTGNVVQLSQHKYASNVVEKCLEYGDSTERDFLIEEILAESEGNDCLLTMMKDQFANYVVQKILEISNNKHREILLSRIRVHLHALKKYTYGKHIVARFEQLSEQLCDEGILEPVNPRSLNKEFSTRPVDGGIVCSSRTVDCSAKYQWQDILGQFSMVNLELYNIVEDIKKVSKAFVVHPKNVNAENAAILPVMLSSKLLPEMEVEDNAKREQLLHSMQNLSVASQIEKLKVRIDMIGAACESAEKVIADTRKAYFGTRQGPTLLPTIDKAQAAKIQEQENLLRTAVNHGEGLRVPGDQRHITSALPGHLVDVLTVSDGPQSFADSSGTYLKNTPPFPSSNVNSQGALLQASGALRAAVSPSGPTSFDTTTASPLQHVNSPRSSANMMNTPSPQQQTHQQQQQQQLQQQQLQQRQKMLQLPQHQQQILAQQQLRQASMPGLGQLHGQPQMQFSQPLGAQQFQGRQLPSGALHHGMGQSQLNQGNQLNRHLNQFSSPMNTALFNSAQSTPSSQMISNMSAMVPSQTLLPRMQFGMSGGTRNLAAANLSDQMFNMGGNNPGMMSIQQQQHGTFGNMSQNTQNLQQGMMPLQNAPQTHPSFQQQRPQGQQ